MGVSIAGVGWGILIRGYSSQSETNTRMVDKAPLPKKYNTPHHLITKLVEADTARSQEKQATWGSASWAQPVFGIKTAQFLKPGLEFQSGKGGRCGGNCRSVRGTPDRQQDHRC